MLIKYNSREASDSYNFLNYMFLELFISGTWSEFYNGDSDVQSCVPESIQWFLETQAFLWLYSMIWLLSPSPLSRQHVASLSKSSCVSPVDLTDRGGGGGGRKKKPPQKTRFKKKK
jgi:hypothetical protein